MSYGTFESIIVVFFTLIAFWVSYIDIKKELILDAIVLPSIALLAVLKWLCGCLSSYDWIAVTIVVGLFVLPVAFNMAFGGGDLRFGAFCALFLGLEGIGYFLLLSGLIHLAILAALKRKTFAFAPAMSGASLITYVLIRIT